MTLNLFGEPTLKPGLSQWHSPPWLARRLASWVPRGARVLEPSCGGGNLLKALLRAGHSATNLCGVEIDSDWARHCVDELPGVRIERANFLELHFDTDEFDVVLTNPPFEDNGHLRFVLRALELAPTVVGIFPAAFEFSQERDRELWSARGVVTRRARMPARVDFGGEEGTGGGKGDTVALLIERRAKPRGRIQLAQVLEEVWLP